MAHQNELARTAKIIDRGASAMLSSFLTLTGDAAVCFDDTGTILLANEQALRMLAPAGNFSVQEELVGADVRQLLPPATASDPQAPFSVAELSVPTNGTAARLVRTSSNGTPYTLVVRCERVSAPFEAYLLVAHPEGAESTSMVEHERLVAELSRANRRLSGTLDIVLGTLDSPDVSTLFERVLEKLRETMDATGTMVYLAEADGYHLRGASASMSGQKVPRFLPRGDALVSSLTRSEKALRLRVLPLRSDELRKGRVRRREVLNEETRETYEVRSSRLAPFASLMVVPVRFGGQVIAVIEVGWRTTRAIPRDDADLLDAVTRYLAVQLVGAFSALRTRRRDELATSANNVRDVLVADPFAEQTRLTVLAMVEEDLGCLCAPLDGPSSIEGHEIVHLPVTHEEMALPAELMGFEDGVTALLPESPLGTWLREHGEPSLGAFVSAGTPDGMHLRFLALRHSDEEPLDDLELGYLRQVADTVSAVSSGNSGRKRDHRISQALQRGMRSELQKVRGITAQGIYSSATEAAFVGGDFYDLIRLPNRRACVIMGDVSGKGVEAASVSAAVRTALGAYSWEGLAPAHMVELLNDFLLGFSRVETFATMFVGIVDLARGSMAYCSAGHPPALMLRADSGELEWLGEQSGVVGAFHDMRYHDGHIALGEGDVLLLYTDGTTEARARDGRFFGEEGLRDAALQEMEKGYDGLLGRLLGVVDDFTGNSLDDDVAMVALRFDEVGKK